MAKKILLIEDETNIRSMYAEMLRDAGYEVHEVVEGAQGLEVAKTELWDLLLLDIMLPSMDGVELLRAIKSDPNTKDRPVVIVTNLGDDDIRSTCAQLGAKEFLVKAEVTPADVVLTVKKYVFND